MELEYKQNVWYFPNLLNHLFKMILDSRIIGPQIGISSCNSLEAITVDILFGNLSSETYRYRVAMATDPIEFFPSR